MRGTQRIWRLPETLEIEVELASCIDRYGRRVAADGEGDGTGLGGVTTKRRQPVGVISVGSVADVELVRDVSSVWGSLKP